MKIQVELDGELVDQVVKNELMWHVHAAQQEIKKFKKIKNPKKFQIEEYNYNQRLLFGLKIVGEYFGVNVKNKTITKHETGSR